MIVEAVRRSSVLAAARAAHDLGRRVYGVPGPSDAATSKGINDLLASGVATTIARRGHQLPGEVAMTSPEQYRAALTTPDLPAQWLAEIEIRPRRRSIGIEVRPGGAIEILVPPVAGRRRGDGGVVRGQPSRWLPAGQPSYPTGPGPACDRR